MKSETLALNSEWQKNGNQTSDVDDTVVFYQNESVSSK